MKLEYSFIIVADNAPYYTILYEEIPKLNRKNVDAIIIIHIKKT